MKPNSIDYGPIKVVKNEMITEIDFVMDYYRLVFESKILTVLADPVVIQNGMRYSKGSTEYYYRFIQVISKKVLDIEFSDDGMVHFILDGKYEIEIPQHAETGTGIETMQDIRDGRWWTW